MHMASDEPVVVDDIDASRFEIRTDAGTALLRYRLWPGAIELVHTEVPKIIEGQHLGSKLARAALEWARERNLRVIPTCPFVRAYIERHPEYESLVRREAASP